MQHLCLSSLLSPSLSPSISPPLRVFLCPFVYTISFFLLLLLRRRRSNHRDVLTLTKNGSGLFISDGTVVAEINMLDKLTATGVVHGISEVRRERVSEREREKKKRKKNRKTKKKK